MSLFPPRSSSRGFGNERFTPRQHKVSYGSSALKLLEQDREWTVLLTIAIGMHRGYGTEAKWYSETADKNTWVCEGDLFTSKLDEFIIRNQTEEKEQEQTAAQQTAGDRTASDQTTEE